MTVALTVVMGALKQGEMGHAEIVRQVYAVYGES